MTTFRDALTVVHLLDANVLIALGWEPHDHHEAAQSWFARHAQAGWASTALTQAAFVRILSQPAISGPGSSVVGIANLLDSNLRHRAHRLLPLDFGFDALSAVCTGGLHGHRQITDAYLLAVAVRNGARLVTFDRGVLQLLATEPERQRHITLITT